MNEISVGLPEDPMALQLEGIYYPFLVLSDPNTQPYLLGFKMNLFSFKYVARKRSVYCNGLLSGRWFALGCLHWATVQTEPLQKCTRIGQLCQQRLRLY